MWRPGRAAHVHLHQAQALPIQAHWCVRCDTPSGREAALKMQYKGFFSKTRIGTRWTGRLAQRLNDDSELMGWLEQLGDNDTLRVKADPGQRLLRIVHQRQMVFAYGLATPKLFELMRGQLAEVLPDAKERIAQHALG